MGDTYSDMPGLVEAGRGFDGAAPPPFPPGPWHAYGQQHVPPPPTFMAQSQSYTPSSSGYPWSSPPDSQSSTPAGWGAMQSMPTTPVPMPVFSGPPVAVMQPFVPVGVGPDGWPRSPGPGHHKLQQQDDGAQWRNGNDRIDSGYPQRPLPRSSTPSLTSSPSSGSGISLHRRPSMRGPGAEATKRPPREWRSDFSMSGPSFIGSLLARSRSRSFGGGDFLHPKVTLSPYIRYNSSKPPMALDLRRDASTLRIRALEHPLSGWDFTRFVCEPPLPSMRLFHAQLPWYIDVEASNPAGVTLHDLFSAIQRQLLSPIEFGDFYNIEMTNDLRDQIAIAWAERCRTAEERSRGVFKVDYLMGKVIMEGIQKGRDGLWEIKTRKP